MATKLFLRSTQNNGIGATYYDMLIGAGAASDTAVVNTAASGTEIQFTKTAGGAIAQWISGRVPAGGFTLTSVDVSIWAAESNMSANAGGRVRVFKRAANGTETELGGGPFDDGVEFGTSATEMTWTANVTDTAFAEDDRVLLKIYITNIGTMGGSFTCTLTFNAADAATGDSFANLAETVTFKLEDITGTVAIASPASSLAATATETFTGTAAEAPPASSLSLTGTETFTGTAAIEPPASSLSLTGTVEEGAGITGTVAIASPASSLAATGTETFTGAAALTSPASSLAATGSETFTGTVGITSPASSLSLTGIETFTGTAAVAPPKSNLAATGTETFTGAATITSPPSSLAGSGSNVAHLGTVAITSPASSLSLTGTVVNPPAAPPSATGGSAASMGRFTVPYSRFVRKKRKLERERVITRKDPVAILGLGFHVTPPAPVITAVGTVTIVEDNPDIEALELLGIHGASELAMLLTSDLQEATS